MNRIKLIRENTENLFFALCLLNKGSSEWTNY